MKLGVLLLSVSTNIQTLRSDFDDDSKLNTFDIYDFGYVFIRSYGHQNTGCKIESMVTPEMGEDERRKQPTCARQIVDDCCMRSYRVFLFVDKNKHVEADITRVINNPFIRINLHYPRQHMLHTEI